MPSPRSLRITALFFFLLFLTSSYGCGGEEEAAPPANNTTAGPNNAMTTGMTTGPTVNNSAGAECTTGAAECLDDHRFRRCEAGRWVLSGCGSWFCRDGGTCDPGINNFVPPENSGGGPPVCLSPDLCRFDHTCTQRADGEAAPICQPDGTCAATPDCPSGDCECTQDTDCDQSSFCDAGSCTPRACKDDCECGAYQECVQGQCYDCRMTCVSGANCISTDSCERYGFNDSCTACVRR